VREEDALRAEYFADVVAKAKSIIGGRTRVSIETEVGHAAQSITQKANEEKFDLVVIGHSGHSGLWGSLLGSTTSRVVEHARCDVLVVR
ncbi:MAG TPA: universal stress protein, partial [Chloroflexota bacterium]